jgi:hypothetical protein
VSDVFARRPSQFQGEPDLTVYVDPTLGEQEARRRWEVRAAQWRAREMAEAVFGGEVHARLSGHSGGSSFRGLLHLDVPFRDLETHRALEAVFIACAAVDPVLERVPLIYVLGPAI